MICFFSSVVRSVIIQGKLKKLSLFLRLPELLAIYYKGEYIMAKRFTDSEKWKDPFFEELTKDLKLAWLYLLDDCDHAGIWKKSIKRLNFSLDTNFTEKDLLEAFKERIIVLNSDKWFIPKFITFQYGNDFIKSKQKAVISAVKILNENNLIKELDNGLLTLSIPLINPMDTLMDTDTDTVMDKDTDTDKNKESVKDMDMRMRTGKSLSKEQLNHAFSELESILK